MSNHSARILIIDDEPQIRKFLRISLGAQGYEVVESALGEEGISTCAIRAPDLIILDLGLPDVDGQELIARLREWCNAPLIVLSVRADETEKVKALELGADDYVTKPFGIAELIARIRVLLRNRQSPQAESQFRSGALTVDLLRREVIVDGSPVHLSRKEYAILKLLVSHPGRVLTHQQILREVWGPAQTNETHYLRVFIGHLRQKLGDTPAQPKYIVTEPGVGYRFRMGETQSP